MHKNDFSFIWSNLKDIIPPLFIVPVFLSAKVSFWFNLRFVDRDVNRVKLTHT